MRRLQITEAPYNPRQIGDRQRGKLKRGIQKLGMLQPLVWNQRTGNLVSGHQRLKLMDEHYGTEDYELQVAVVDLDEKQEKEANVLLNNYEAQGDWDLDLLNELLAEPEIDLEATGFDPVDVYRLFGDKAHLDATAAEAYAEDVRNALEARQEVAKLSDDRSTDYYIVFVFAGESERNAFLEDNGLEPNRFQDGRDLEALVTGRPREVEPPKMSLAERLRNA